jgi:hypothetical protein
MYSIGIDFYPETPEKEIEPGDRPFTKEDTVRGYASKPINIIDRRAVRSREWRKEREKHDDY